MNTSPAYQLPNISVVLRFFFTSVLLCSCHKVYIGGGTRGAGGATAPPDFKIYAFGPPRFQNQKLTNIGWKSLLSMYYSFSSIAFMRARGLCIHSYLEIKEPI